MSDRLRWLAGLVFGDFLDCRYQMEMFEHEIVEYYFHDSIGNSERIF